MTSPRASFDSESGYSLVDHIAGHGSESVRSGGGRHGREVVGRDSPLGRSYGVSSDGRLNSYSISSIMSTPTTSAAATLTTNLSNLNPLRSTGGPKTGATRGKAATPIVLSELPKVSRRDFDAYIESIRTEYTAWSKLQSALADAPILDGLDDADQTLDEESSKRRRAIAQALEGSSLGQKGKRRLQLPPLEDIPQIFFEENFNLANPRTFEVVTGGVASDSSGSSRKSLSDFSVDQVLQEKLSHYLDIVEAHLSVEISMRSASFFSALSNLQALDSQSAEALKQIASLKMLFGEVDETVAKKGLEAVRKGVRRRKLKELDAGIQRIKDIIKSVDQAEDLGEAGEVEGALDLIEALEAEWQASLQNQPHQAPAQASGNDQPALSSGGLAVIGEEDDAQDSPKPPPSPLTGLFTQHQHHAPVRIAKIRALSALPTRLLSLRGAIAQSVEHELVAVLTYERRQTLDSYVASGRNWREARTGKPSLYDEAKLAALQKVKAILSSLVRCGKSAVDAAITAWRSATLKELRKDLKDLVPAANLLGHEEDDGLGEYTPESGRSSLEDGRPTVDGRSSTAISLRDMPHSAYMSLIRRVHATMLGCLAVADLQSQVIFEVVIERLGTGFASKSVDGGGISIGSHVDDSWKTAIRSDLDDVVQAAAELANVRLAKIATSRADVHLHLPLAEFIAVFDDAWQFVLDCETLSRKMIVGLRGVMVAQSKAFLQTFHQQQLSEAARLLETEQWSPADVPAVVQRCVMLILDSAMQDPPDLKIRLGLPQAAKAAPSAKLLIIDDKEYFAVSAGLKAIETVNEYLKVVINLPQLATDVISKVIEFLKQFNSRTCQVVLGAGAMRSAGLKNITAKHLALASQALSIMISLIPYIRECLRRHLRAKQAVILVDFDKLKRDYQEHQYEIHAKLVSIMGDRLAVHCKTLQGIDWEKPTGRKEGTPNAYMETLVKETSTLHKVLFKYLPGTALEMVMMQVLSAINSRLAEEYAKIEVKSDGARERILDDARYMRAKFAELKGLERPAPGAELEDLIKMKRLVAPPPQAPAAKAFATPSLTRPRTASASQHKRTPSTTSLNKPETPAKDLELPPPTPEKEKPTAELARPLPASGSTQPGNEADVLLGPADAKGQMTEHNTASEGEAAPAASSTIAGEATEVSEAPETIPLPPSPTSPPADISELEFIPPVSTEVTKSTGADAVMLAPSATSAIERRPSAAERLRGLITTSSPIKTAVQDQNPALPQSPVTSPVEKSAKDIVQAALGIHAPSMSPPPAVNVKNRLASLFNKRAEASAQKASTAVAVLDDHTAKEGDIKDSEEKAVLSTARVANPEPPNKATELLPVSENADVVTGSLNVSMEDLTATINPVEDQAKAADLLANQEETDHDMEAVKAELMTEVDSAELDGVDQNASAKEMLNAADVSDHASEGDELGERALGNTGPDQQAGPGASQDLDGVD